MTCSWCEERFERLLDDELPPAERMRLQAHVDTCAACRSLLDELRVIDGLLLQPRTIEPGPEFTDATMAELRSLPHPAPPRSHWPAYLTCYVVGAWCLVAAGFVLARHRMLAFGQTLRDVAQTLVDALAGVLHVAAHLGNRGDLTSWATLAGGVVVVDLGLLLTLVAARRYGGPWFSERYRS